MWDTNRLCPVRSQALSTAIYHHALSPVAAAAPVIALALADKAVALYDVRAGTHAHRLGNVAGCLGGRAGPGHDAFPATVAWSPECEWLLATGGSEGRALLWDVRSATGSLAALDQHDGHGLGVRARITAQPPPTGGKGECCVGWLD